MGDGNCLFRAISNFIKGNEYMYNVIRTQIYNEAINRINLIPNITIESERGNMHMHTYIQTIKDDGNYGGDFEISLAYDICKINIAEYKTVYDNNNNIINFTFIKYINDDNNESRDLIILLSFNNYHFNLGYYNNTILDLNYNPENKNSNNNLGKDKNNITFDDELNKNYKNSNNVSNNKENKINIDINNKYDLADLSNKDLSFILEYYNDKNNKLINYAVIYYYLHYYNETKGRSGKFSKNFYNINNNSNNLQNKKKQFKKN